MSLIRVKDHTNGMVLKDECRETEDYQITIPQATLEDAQRTVAGRFLLQLLGAVDHAGNGLDAKGQKGKRAPVMLLGWKHRHRLQVGPNKFRWTMVDGFTLFVTVPQRVRTSMPALYAGPGATKV